MSEYSSTSESSLTIERPRAASQGAAAARGARAVSQAVVNFFVDLALLTVLAALGATAVVVQYVFPPGTAADGWLLWGLSYNAWARLQFGLTGVLVLGVLVHVMLHWTWVCGVVVSKLLRRKHLLAKQDDGSRTLYGVATLIALLTVVGTIVAAANLSIQAPDFGALIP